MSDGIIETVDLTYWYAGNDRPSLDKVNITIKKGVKTIILGGNGAGKSTLFYHSTASSSPAPERCPSTGRPSGTRGRRSGP